MASCPTTVILRILSDLRLITAMLNRESWAHISICTFRDQYTDSKLYTSQVEKGALA